jgi:hypothetical protein
VQAVGGENGVVTARSAVAVARFVEEVSSVIIILET